MTMTKAKGITALAGWFGSNRMLANNVGEALAGCSWVGVLFAGGMSELPHITARTILVNDKHLHVINLARVVANDAARGTLIRRLQRKAFHPEELKFAQEVCAGIEPHGLCDIDAAEQYFVCCWMNRGGKAGIDSEFNGRTAVRWKSDGGDSMVRFRSAIRMLGQFSRTLKRCTFETMDAFEFVARCEDDEDNGLYADPPFPGAGRRYKHNAGQTEAEERAWHTRLAAALSRFERTRVVARFYDHPLIRELYPPDAGWLWKELTGRKQSNEDAAEVLLVRNPGKGGGLF